MSSFSKTIITGHAGNKPELRNAAGKSVCSFSVAVNGRKKDAPPTWFKVTAWEKLAETCSQYLDKGRAVLVEGEVSLETWTDKKTGEIKSGIALRANGVTFLGSKGDGADRGGGRPVSRTTPNDDLQEGDDFGIADDPLPF